MSDRSTIDSFLRRYSVEMIGDTPPQPTIAEPKDDEPGDTIDYTPEMPADQWKAITISEAPARSDEHPTRFIDGSIFSEPVLCVRAPAGWPIPILIAEVGATALQLKGRRFERSFVFIERLLGFVADPFPWEEVEAFASAIAADPGLNARLVVGNMPRDANPFDYEAMRQQAYHRCEQDMLNAERLALESCVTEPTLVDGKLASRIGTNAAKDRPLLVGIVKRTPPELHEEGWRTLLSLRPGQRTPLFQLTGMSAGKVADMPTASWFLKLAGGPRLAPNWGIVRVDVPWVQFENRTDQFGLVNRLSRWLIDARCRAESYARMPVSLEPIVRAEEVLKPLFTPISVLANRLRRQAGPLGMNHE